MSCYVAVLCYDILDNPDTANSNTSDCEAANMGECDLILTTPKTEGPSRKYEDRLDLQQIWRSSSPGILTFRVVRRSTPSASFLVDHSQKYPVTRAPGHNSYEYTMLLAFPMLSARTQVYFVESMCTLNTVAVTVTMTILSQSTIIGSFPSNIAPWWQNRLQNKHESESMGRK